jgi:tRNA nucleotidyltransferase (CCA-adding enzyme)
MGGNPKLIDKLFSRLTPDEARLVEALTRASGNARPFLVGGSVRDLLLDRPWKDLDISVEGDAVSVAERAAASADGAVNRRSAFGTVVLRVGSAEADLVMARSESYPRPGSLPVVRPGTIEEDLLRRDFSVNSMALQLTGKEAGGLLDPAGGQRDLRDGLIRVLHAGSFRDDATRILRAVRYKERLGFAVEAGTLALLRRDLGYLAGISGARIKREVQRALSEEHAAASLSHLDALGVLGGIHGALSFGAEQAEGLAWLHLQHDAPMGSSWAVLLWRTPVTEVDALSARLALTGREKAVVVAARVDELERVLQGGEGMSRVGEVLETVPAAAVMAVAAMAGEGAVRERALRYLSRRALRPRLSGFDIVALGVEPGPAVGRALSVLRAARLDGRTAGRRDEERLVKELAITERETGGE